MLTEAGIEVELVPSGALVPGSEPPSVRTADVVVLAVPDDRIASMAGRLEVRADRAVVHLSGALGPEVLEPHPRRGSLHPLAVLGQADAERAAKRLRSGLCFAVAGDPVVWALVDRLGGRALALEGSVRARYHAGAVAASNHLVGLVAEAASWQSAPGLDAADLAALGSMATADAAEVGPEAALTGPLARGDAGVVAAHLAGLDARARHVYLASAGPTARLADRRGRRVPAPRRPGPAVRALRDALLDASGVARAGSRRLRSTARIEVLGRALRDASVAGLVVGLVPTMGALHEGHRSLLRRARQDCDVVAASVFVNPTQFGQAEDFERYPRTTDADLDVLEQEGVDVALVPEVEDVYPPGFSTTIEVAGPALGWEGADRPGHFAGVATVVARLLVGLAPGRAYFGEKDFQQLAVVRRLSQDLGVGVEIVGCPTVREHDGLACSSRNRRLSPEGRRAAVVLWQALQAGRALVVEGERDPSAVRERMASVVAGTRGARLCYAAVVDPASLAEPAELRLPARLLIAVEIEGVRLIDNLGIGDAEWGV